MSGKCYLTSRAICARVEVSVRCRIRCTISLALIRSVGFVISRTRDREDEQRNVRVPIHGFLATILPRTLEDVKTGFPNRFARPDSIYRYVYRRLPPFLGTPLRERTRAKVSNVVSSVNIPSSILQIASSRIEIL